MARIFIDGFENGSYTLWTRPPANNGVSSSTKYGHNYAADLQSCLDYALLTLSTTYTTIYFQMRFRINALPVVVSNILISFSNSSGSWQACLAMNTSGKLYAIRGGKDGTTLATGGTTISANTWYLLEGKLVIDSSSGIFQVKLNSVASPLEIDYSGNTQGAADSIIKYVRIGDGWDGANGISHLYIDDFVLDDAEMPGGTTIQGLQVAGRNVANQWTPSSGFNFDCVDEIPPSDVDKVSATSVDLVDLYPVTSPVQGCGTIKCVQVAARSYLTGSPTPTKVKVVVKTHDTEYDSDALNPSTGLANSRCVLHATNPNTSSAWTFAELQALMIGMKSAS